jgi:phosphoglycerate dehydrogenase-like enzyme
MNKKLKIWCNNLYIPLTGKDEKLLRKSLIKFDFHLFKPNEKGTDSESAKVLSEADIAFGSPNADALTKCKNLAWVHLNTAGYTAYDGENFKQVMRQNGTILTNSSSVYDEPCAQHLLAMILSLARKLPAALDEQRSIKSWKQDEFRSKITLLNEQTVLIFGFGAIAKRLVELLAPLKMKIIGVRRQIKGNEQVKIITESKIDKYLPLADHVINILPDNGSTKNFFNFERLSKIKPGGLFYNIGRGTTVEQDVLRELLEQNKIAAAYLDVTNPEPLPPENPLWTTPNCYITPHVAGGSVDEKDRQINHFLENLRRFSNGESLIDRIL